jgi:5-(hydroxymethyl)furfural/furfural oxidase
MDSTAVIFICVSFARRGLPALTMRGEAHVRFRDPRRRIVGLRAGGAAVGRSRNRVLLVEAGKDVTAETAPADVLASYPGRAYFNPDFTWPGLDVLLGGASQNDPASRRRARYEQARILGGGSSINGLCANRGAPTDYDSWEQLGATGWNFASVLPYFRKLERDLDFDGAYHGKDGRSRSAAIRSRTGPASSARSRRCWRSAACRSCRPERQVDRRRDAGRGLDRRERPACLLRDGVSHAAGARAQEPRRAHRDLCARILFDGTRAVGAEIARGGETEVVHGRELVLTCGSIHSPAVLMRSGVGAPDELAKHGIAVVAALPGVGRNLIEHPSVSISCYLGGADGSRIWSGITPRRMCGSRRACRAVRPAT